MSKTFTFLVVLGLLLTGVGAIPVYAQEIGGEVVVEGTGSAEVSVDRLPDSSIAKALFDRASNTWPWYTTRASGLIAGLLLAMLMLSGSGFITGGTFRFLEPITAWATHRALGIALGIAVTVHVVALYFETFVYFDVTSLLIPFVSDYSPVTLFGVYVGSLYVALGILAMYLFFAIILTSLFLIDRKPKTWKLVHLLSYLGMVFVFVHALYLGTDLAKGALRIVWIALGVAVTYVTFKRLWRGYTV